jgi:glutamyl-tRNA reductase
MAAAEHLFRVASGLESQVLGEPQVLSQVRDALETAHRLEAVGPNLHSLFRAAISCARQARAGTTLGRVNVSIGSEAVRAAIVALGSIAGRGALLIGGGEIARLVAEELRREKAGTLFIANRTESVAVDLAAHFRGTPARLVDIPRIIPTVDLVITCTSANHYVLTPEDFARGSQPKRAAPLQVFDLAIPRDVDPAVGSIPGVVLHDLDGLLPAGVEEQWDADVRAMEAVIAAEVHEFTAWYLTRRVAPVIASLRSHVEAVSEQELRRVAPRLADLTDREREAVESLTNRLIDKMFHHLVLRLRLAAQTDPRLVEAAEFFFLHGEGGLFEHAAEQEERSATSRQPSAADSS